MLPVAVVVLTGLFTEKEKSDDDDLVFFLRKSKKKKWQNIWTAGKKSPMIYIISLHYY